MRSFESLQETGDSEQSRHRRADSRQRRVQSATEHTDQQDCAAPDQEATISECLRWAGGACLYQFHSRRAPMSAMTSSRDCMVKLFELVREQLARIVTA